MQNFELLQGYIGLGQCLIKADKHDRSVIYIEASNQMIDVQNDIVLQKALRDEAENFLKKGVISWDHLHKIEKNPRYICGEPLDVAFPKDGRTLVKARMYPDNEYGQSILSLAKSESTRLGASVGGAILQRTKAYVSSLKKSVQAIVKVLWDEVAVTHRPVNEDTLGRVTYVPFDDFAKSFIQNDEERAAELLKALTAGYGADSSQFTGGRALIPESLMGASKRSKEKLVQAFNITLDNIKKKKVKKYKDLASSLEQVGLKSYAAIVAETIIQQKEKLEALLK